MPLIANFCQPDVCLTRGDVVGVARAGLTNLAAQATNIPSSEAPLGPPDVNHVQRREEELQLAHQVDLPPENYYTVLEEWRKTKFPNADPFVLEHCAALEPFMDTCIITGFSLGAGKSAKNIFQPEVKFLGDMCGRHGLTSTEEHLDAVKHFGEIETPEAMRRFLGAFGWTRKSFPQEVIIILPALTGQLKKEAVWPMPPAAQQAKLALQALACRAITLTVVDELAAITGDRPLEQVADGCMYGWGGTVYQMSPCLRFLEPKGMYSGLLTSA
jgi:hypothetical protein